MSRGHTWGSIYKTTDGGAKWTEINKRLPNGYVSSLAIDSSDSNTVYAGIHKRAILKSTNGGASWTAMSNGIPAGEGGDIAIDPSNTNTVYAAINSKLFKSTNGGWSWAEVFLQQTRGKVIVIAMAPSRPGTIYVGSSMRIFKSTNGGTDWASAGDLIRAGSRVSPVRNDGQQLLAKERESNEAAFWLFIQLVEPRVVRLRFGALLRVRAGLVAIATEVNAQQPSWSATGSLGTGRFAPTATL